MDGLKKNEVFADIKDVICGEARCAREKAAAFGERYEIIRRWEEKRVLVPKGSTSVHVMYGQGKNVESPGLVCPSITIKPFLDPLSLLNLWD